MNLLKKITVITVLYAVLLGLLVAPVSADGSTTKTTKKVCRTTSYGNTVCEEVTEETTEKEVVVDTGIAENVAIALVLFGLGYIALLSANKFSRAY